MKPKFYTVTIIACIFFLHKSTAQTNVFPSTGAAGIGTTTPDASSLFEVVSTSKGVLIPRMTKTQRDAIASPATGLLIYQTNNTPGFYYYSGTAWTAMSSKGANTSLSNLKSPTAVNVDLLPASDYGQSLGSATHAWNNLFLLGSVYLGGTRFLGNNAGTGLNNTDVGANAGINNSTGSGNTAAGSLALFSTTTGSTNTAVGGNALYSNTNGYSNVAIGAGALYSNVSDHNEVAIGDSALFNESSGSGINTAVGSKALYANTTGYGNTAVGSKTLTATTTGIWNTAVGAVALSENTTGFNNTAIGEQALWFNTTGVDNVAVGQATLQSSTSSNKVAAVGAWSLMNHKIGDYNTALGFAALELDSNGIANLACGAQALHSNKSGYDNAATGINALYGNTTGSGNTASGYSALLSNITGQSNVAVGINALRSSTIQSNIVAVGDSALLNNGGSGSLDGIANVAVGSKALYTNTTGRANSGFGLQALYANTTGIHNTALGYFAGNVNTSGSSNTFLGDNTNPGSGTLSNSTAIGSGAIVTASNNFVFGNSSVVKWGFGQTAAAGNIIDFVNTTAKLTTGGVWTNASDRRLKNNFQKLDRADILAKISKLDVQRWHYIKDGSNITHIGPVAQDFYEAFNVGDDTTISTIDPAGVALLGIQQLAIKETAKDAQIDALQKQNELQQQQINELRSIVQQLQQQYLQCNPCSGNISSQRNNENIQQQTINVPAASLTQNIPNPFNRTTTISYVIPQNCSSAKIIITDKSGKALKETNLSVKGAGSLKVDAALLSAGAYQYSLYVDGRLIDTKQMISLK